MDGFWSFEFGILDLFEIWILVLNLGTCSPWRISGERMKRKTQMTLNGTQIIAEKDKDRRKEGKHKIKSISKVKNEESLNGRVLII